MKKSNSSLITRHKSSKHLRNLSSNKALKNAVNFEKINLEIFEEYAVELHRVFVAYASLGEPNNTTLLKSLKFHKMLKDAGILAKRSNNLSFKPRSRNTSSDFLYDSNFGNDGHLSSVQADFIYVTLTG